MKSTKKLREKKNKQIRDTIKIHVKRENDEEEKYDAGQEKKEKKALSLKTKWKLHDKETKKVMLKLNLRFVI